MHSSKTSHRLWRNEWRGEIFFDDGDTNARGVAILFRSQIKPSQIVCKRNFDGRFVTITFVLNGMSFKICCLYAPNEDTPQMYSFILESCNQSTEDHVILAGDFNVYLDKKRDKKGGVITKSKSREIINVFMEENNWVDVWRAFNSDKFQFTWRRKSPLIMHRLDYFITPLATFKTIKNCEIIANSFSDHSAVVLNMDFESNIRGPGLRKLNTSYLNDLDYVNEMNDCLDIIDNKYQNFDPFNKWEGIKNDVHSVSASFACNKAIKRKQDIQIWNKKLNAAQKKLAMINLSSDIAVYWIQKINNKIDEYKLKLQSEEKRRAQGAMVRAKARWTAHAEHITKYFFNLEK